MQCKCYVTSCQHVSNWSVAFFFNFLRFFSNIFNPTLVKSSNVEPKKMEDWLYWDCPYFSVQFSCSVVSDSLQPHGLQYARLPCPSPTPRACSDSCPSSRWCHPTTSSSVVPFSSCLQSFPASGSFQRSQFFASGDQSIGASALASFLPMNIQD